VPLLTTKDVSLIMRGRLYSSCVRSSMLPGSETWPIRKENVMARQWAERRMVRWMWGIKLKDRFSSKELKERLGIDDIALVLQQNRLRWYGHVLRKEDNDWVKKCIEYELSERTVKHVNWTQRMLWIVVNGGSWQRMSDDHDGCELVSVSSGAGPPG